MQSREKFVWKATIFRVRATQSLVTINCS